MKCPSCAHGNREAASFCESCGEPMPVACPGCGTALRDGARFCDSCGEAIPGLATSGSARGPSRSEGRENLRSSSPSPKHGSASASPSQRSPAAYTPKHLAEKILASKSALEGERKQVTVLFADVKGSMEMAEQVDPEEWHRILNRFFEILGEGVHRFEGTVNQFTGDGIMALFGAPIAHEDHANRACFAALHLGESLRRYADELRRSEGLNFSVRMGINSGEVVVGKIGDDLRMDYTAQGHTVNLAARMENLAEPGKVYLTGDTAGLVEGFFALRDLGAFDIKGVRDPVHVYELQGAGPLRTRLEVSRKRGFSRFVGRDEEMAILEDALAQTLKGKGRFVAVVAEAGTGKSRLCHEFLERCRARGIPVHEGHCVPHGRMIPFLPIREVLGHLFGLSAGEPDALARQKIAGALLLLDESFRELLPLVLDFMGLPDPDRPPPRMDPEARQRAVVETIRRIIHARGRTGQPVVILAEDLHWIDDASEAVLAQLGEVVGETPRMLLANFRPEYRRAWLDAPHGRTIRLRPLAPADAGALLRELLGDDPSVADLAASILARTAGNPFFIEETVRALAESGRLQGGRGRTRLPAPIGEDALPATVQAVLAARIDRLPEREKQTLQAASVIGKEFAQPLLARVAGLGEEDAIESLAALAEAEFIHPTALFPEREYAFEHPLTQEVAYRSQLQARRAQVHGEVARALGEMAAGREDENAALLAHHWELAGDRMEAARWACRAAIWSGTRDRAESARHWRKLRDLTDNLPASAESLDLGKMARVQMLNAGMRSGLSEEEAAKLYEQGVEMAAGEGDNRYLAMLKAAYTIVRGMAGAAEEALALGFESIRLADEVADPSLALDFRVGPVYLLSNQGRFQEALEMTDQALARASGPAQSSGIIGFDATLWFQWYRGVILIDVGRFEEGEGQLERACTLARDRGELEVLGWATGTRTYLARLQGENEKALRFARESLDLAQKIGSSLSICIALWTMGQAHVSNGQWDDAMAAVDQGLALAREKGAGLRMEPTMLALLAEALLGKGDIDRAREAAEKSLAIARRRKDFWEYDAQQVLARILLRAGGPRAADEAQEAAEKALAIIEVSGGRSREPFIHLIFADVALARGDGPGRKRALEESLRLFRAMGLSRQVEATERLLTG